MAAVDASLERLAGLVRRGACVVALTGAGVSTESGVPDFRSGSGLWGSFDPARVASIHAFLEDPRPCWAFYAARIAGLRDARPNAGHLAIARLQRAGRIARLVTQNVDGLHREAGSEAVEVHGAIDHARCLRCGRVEPAERVAALVAADAEGLPRCPACASVLKPGVVMFGEMLPADALAEAERWAARADVLLAIGSTLEVWPVAGLPRLAREEGATVAVLNRGPTAFDGEADIRLEGALGTLLPALASRVLDR